MADQIRFYPNIILGILLLQLVASCQQNSSVADQEEENRNRLAGESSPYLLQHANNPVDWWPWSEEAFAKAKAEDKAVVVSIGYSTCHWCHVMEEESFEDPEVAAFMNEHFVSIKVDREERPDVDQLYMAACQAITGKGGWPLNAFLLPDGRPFYAGTYFPPKSDGQRRGWLDLLKSIATAYRDDRSRLVAQATQLTDGLAATNSIDFAPGRESSDFDRSALDTMMLRLQADFDHEFGGFGNTQKFPSVQSLELLLDYGILYEDQASLDMVFQTMSAMLKGGIYDQLGGGFSRYSVDREWRIPHFEKMLYDNGQLLKILGKIQMINPSPEYANGIAETVKWLQQEMQDESGAFYAALDADSEGEEGKFYQWSYAELERLLDEDQLALVEQYFGVEKTGNHPEGAANILYRSTPLPPEKTEAWNAIRKLLLTAREKRVRPGRDNKIILQWNAYAISGLCYAYRATGNESYRSAAERAYGALEDLLFGHGKWYRSSTAGRKGEEAFLSDLAALNEARMDLYDLNFDLDVLLKTGSHLEAILSDFARKENELFPSVPASRNELPLITADIYDNALPSANSQMVSVLRRFSAYSGKTRYQQIGNEICGMIAEQVTQYPHSFAGFGRQLMLLRRDERCLVVSGPQSTENGQQINFNYYPDLCVVAATHEVEDLPIVQGRFQSEVLQFYLCENQTCRLPVAYLEALDL